MPEKLIILNKPFHVLSQFTADDGKDTLANYIDDENVYAAGRLDYDSEGLLLLTNNGSLQHLIASPKFKMPKTYWVQVEGEITDDAIGSLCRGVELKDGMTKPAECRKIDQPNIWDRTPAVRYRANIPTSWVALTITEGKNRQVRRMTAAVGFPTLRLIRYSIGPYTVDSLRSGESKIAELTSQLREQVSEFEQKKRATPPNRSRHRSKGQSLPDGKGNTRRHRSAQSARRPR
ncbi:pseudouridine synthase [Marinomonas mediterranea]|jgi:ribosomal large subunit pseudouridine synthase E (EC 5.4.99.-)|uniref:Pseudouridine synthase n=1 Tax=Marinomonas mediterranea (strain ATCC 700492 / JCM 21426 / NBRC 103028 / MMB-1) TaxID=717774 RepID=F2JWE0_MARM1|nr:pseudouridine synthase [Marinomonas mediterranea]ADZ90613.1 pseudouridine synthase Rsu [Marinomonas mediterranea MMB-1]WCN08655.1 pseudouridine synthase [Marinomonas mediterranea]WCN12710.1 pseudouridine synthase [Marinomonas mediterranea]WCN16783.1 pseudouridine synthase [Marinomonas mediterranea MMB-1]